MRFSFQRRVCIGFGMDAKFEIFLVVPPGLEAGLASEASELGFTSPQIHRGGVSFEGHWPDVWRANLVLRGATRVLVRIGSFRAMHLAQLDKRARKFDWTLFPRGAGVKVEVTCKASRIYHAGAAKQRISTALDAAGLTTDPASEFTLRTRIEDDLCTFSIDTSGAPLHKRGHKEAVGKAPLRETLAAHFLRMCNYDGREPLIDPMCGSGTFPIEAAEISRGLHPGRARTFAFEKLATFDPTAWNRLLSDVSRQAQAPVFGFDRDQGVIGMARKNAERAGVNAKFECQPVSALTAPVQAPGLIMVNPPYGARIGNKKTLFALYGSLGARVKEQFKGWRLGLVTSDAGLARATGLHFENTSPLIPHGGLRIKLYQARL